MQRKISNFFSNASSTFSNLNVEKNVISYTQEVDENFGSDGDANSTIEQRLSLSDEDQTETRPSSKLFLINHNCNNHYLMHLSEFISIFLLILSLKVHYNCCEVNQRDIAAKLIQQQQKTAADKSDVDHHTDLSNKKEYAKLLRIKRNEQTILIKSLAKIPDNNRKNSILTEFSNSIEETIRKSKMFIKDGVLINFQQFPMDENLRENVAKIIENALLFGEMSLYYPDFVHKFLKKRPQFYQTYKWAYSFAGNFSVYDKSTLEMMDLAGQELELIPRHADYINPYSFAAQKEEMERKALRNMEDSNKRKKNEKNQQKMKKPTLSNTELKMATPLPTFDILQKRINGNMMDLSALRLKKIPFELIWQCLGTDRDRELQITKVNLSNNLLTSFPAKFCVLFPGVEFLDLRRNRLVNLPDNFGNISALKRLNLAHNQIKTIPKSFGDLEELEWLDLSHNPLDQDLLEIIGNCLTHNECIEAAKNAVQYIQFSTSLSYKSTSTEINKSLSMNHSSTNNSDNESPAAEYFRHKQGNYRGRKYPKLEGSRIPTTDPGSKHFCSNGTNFVLILISFTLLGIPIWLTLDSMRANCVNEDYYGYEEEEERFCTNLAEFLSTGQSPSLQQFTVDFLKTFKTHWLLLIHSQLEKVESTDWRGWIETIVVYIKFIVQFCWSMVQPIFAFFADYLLHLWVYYVRPFMQQN